MQDSFENENLPQTTLSELRTLYFTEESQTALKSTRTESLAFQMCQLAQNFIHSPLKKYRVVTRKYEDSPIDELDIHRTLEERGENIYVTAQEERDFRLSLVMDASLSMSGEKHFLSALAMSVFLMSLSQRQTSVMVFGSQATLIKGYETYLSHLETIQKFLSYRPQGYTNISLGLKKTLDTDRSRYKEALLITDGRYTEGEDPVIVAGEYHHLHVIHLCGPGSYREVSQEIASKGRGKYFEVETLRELPKKISQVVRVLSA